jgi:streptogrisin D
MIEPQVSTTETDVSAVHGKLDELAGIPNTSWGVDPSSNQVSVKIYDGVSSAERARIERVAADHGDAVRIERRHGKLERTAYAKDGSEGQITNSR